MIRAEDSLQRSVVRYLDAAYPGLLWSHFPAGERRDAITGAKLKAMGLKAGWPDILIVMPTGTLAALELKAPKGRASEAQKAFREKALACGCLYAEARSLEDVQGTLDAWLRPLGHYAKARIA